MNFITTISPPVTPKLQMESFHEDGWDSSSTTSSSASSIVCISSTPSYYSRRKQRPIQSLPKSTKGTFYMPTFVPTPPTTTPEITILSLNEDHLPQKKRKHLHTSNVKDTQCKSSEKLSFNTSIMTHNKQQHNDEQPKQQQIKSIESIENREMLATNCIKSDLDNIPSDTQQQPEETSKKAKTSAAYIFDNLSADIDQSVLFTNSEEWIPKLDVFDRRPAVRISWKGSPLKIRNMPYFEKLHAGEVTIAATLRLTPEQYLKCKWALVLAAKEASENNTLFRKSEAQKVCCIDVNKTSVLWNAFGKLGWLGSKWPQ